MNEGAEQIAFQKKRVPLAVYAKIKSCKILETQLSEGSVTLLVNDVDEFSFL